MRAFRDPGSIETAVGAIARDRTSGASRLTSRSLGILAATTPRRPGADPRTWFASVVHLGHTLEALRPGMPAIGNAVRSALAACAPDVRRCRTAAEAHGRLRTRLREERERLERLRAAAAATFHRRFPGLRRPVVISHSATLLAVLTHASNRFRSVAVCESRPMFEGRRLARALARSTATEAIVELVTDAQAAAALRRADAFLMGCDAIFSDGAAANKCGSATVAAAARHLGRPVVVVGDSYKFAAKSSFSPESHAGEEVWAGAPANVVVRNEYFEIVTRDLIDHVVLEDAVLRPASVAPRWRRRPRGPGRRRAGGRSG